MRADPASDPLAYWPKDSCPAQGQRDQIYALALAGDRVAWGEKTAGLSFEWLIRQTTLGSSPQTVDLAKGENGLGAVYNTVAGSGALLVFNDFPGYRKTSIYRAEPGGCPCPTLRTDPGPLYLDDVNSGRIVAHGTNAVVVVDQTGAQQLSLPIVNQSNCEYCVYAQLAGSDLVVVAENDLRDYDATTGALLHQWRLAISPSDLQDVAAGLAAYVTGDGVHLIRLSDGKTATVAIGTLACFTSAGLVYADGARLHLVPFDHLPLQ